MTEAQASFLKRLSEDAGVPFDPNLSKADASRRIDELRSSAPARRPGKRGRREPTPASDGDQPTTDGREPMTKAQAAYLKELAEEEGGEFERDLSREEAARRIGELLVKQLARGAPTAPSRR
jgi:hypothetical protein